MSEIVKYHNDFNKIRLPSFNEQEQNLLFGILTKVKEKKTGEKITLNLQDLKTLSGKNLTNKELSDIMFVLKQKFFKADFTILLKKEEFIDNKKRTLIGEATINLFQEIIFWSYLHEVVDDNDSLKNFSHIDLMLNPRFEYLLNDLLKNFTAFELAEFTAISGKYTKTLYRLLKQYRTTGFLRMLWDDFVRVMDISQNRAMRDIDNFILKPALKELTKERNLFDQKRTPFENLAYKKIKEKGTRGRGGKVVGIEFSFKPEKIKNAELTDERKFDLGKLIGSKWYHRALGVFEITSGDISDKSNLIIDYSLENGDCGSFKFRNFNELQLKFAEFEPYA